MPNAKVRELKFVFNRADSEPANSSFRLWLAALKNNVTGTVKKSGKGAAGLTVKLYAPGSTKALATTKTLMGGGYAFPNIAATKGYKVKVKVPSGYVGTSSKTVSIATNDATANFSLRKKPKKVTTPRFTG